MDYRHQQIQDCFFNTCKQHSMINVDPTPLLAMHDNSVYFVSATITGLKDMLLKNEIPNNGVYLYQPCFRLQNIHDPFYNGTKIKYPGYFNMLATLVPAQSIVKLQQIIVDIMDQQGIARNRIKLNTTKKEPLLIKDLQNYYEAEYDTRPEKSYNWTYGMGDDIHGKGMTFYIRQNTGEYKRLGQYVIIYNKDTPIAAEYGWGIEVFLARTKCYSNEYDAFAIAPILSKYGFDVNFTNEHVFSSAAATYSTGLSMNHNPGRNHRQNVRYVIRNLVFLKDRDKLSDEQISSVLKEYSIVEFGNDKYVKEIMTDLHDQEKVLASQKDKVRSFINNPQNKNKTPIQIEKKLQDLYPFYSQYMMLIKQNQKESL